MNQKRIQGEPPKKEAIRLNALYYDLAGIKNVPAGTPGGFPVAPRAPSAPGRTGRQPGVPLPYRQNMKNRRTSYQASEEKLTVRGPA